MVEPERDAPRSVTALPRDVREGSHDPDGGEVARARSGPAEVVATLALGAAVGLGIASMFPDYLSGASIASQPDLVVAHAIPLAGWLVVAVLVASARPGTRQLGALGGIGIGAVDAGFVLADAGTVFSGGGHLGGAGLVLAALEWLLATGACTLVAARSGDLCLERPVRQRQPGGRRATLAPAATAWERTRPWAIGAGAVAAAGLYAPPWDRLVVDLAAVGRTAVVTAGNAFANPAAVIAGNVVVIVCLAALPLVALVMRPRGLGGALLAGGVVGAASQVASALVQWREPVPPSELGLSAQAAAAAGFHASTGFTPMFYGFAAAVVLLGVAALADLVRGTRSSGPARLADVREIPARRPFSPTPHY